MFQFFAIISYYYMRLFVNIRTRHPWSTNNIPLPFCPIVFFQHSRVIAFWFVELWLAWDIVIESYDLGQVTCRIRDELGILQTQLDISELDFGFTISGNVGL